MLEIKVNGQGISSDNRDKVFQMFYRANEQSDGSGLGLFIVHEAIVKLRGSIVVEPQSGEGCTFTMTFPMKVK